MLYKYDPSMDRYYTLTRRTSKVFVGKSKGRGEGLFAAKRLGKGDTIRYHGVYCSYEDWDNKETDHMYGSDSGSHIVDAHPRFERFPGEFVAGRMNEPGPDETPNAQLHIDNDKVFVLITRPIKKGQELLSCYCYKKRSRKDSGLEYAYNKECDIGREYC